MTQQSTCPLPCRASHLRACLRCTTFVLMTLLLFFPVLLLWLLTLERLRARVVCLFYRLMLRISGLRLKVEGELSAERPIMLVANHSSYLDIFVLGALAPLSFTPKREIRSWPIIGFLCVLADCVFIERKPADMQRAKAEMGARLAAGKIIALFPEGTTGDGITIKPFKSGFLNLAEAHDLPLQPAVIAYTHIGEVPLSAQTREKVAWIGEASFVDHFWRLLKLPYVQVTVRLCPVERIANYEDRKALAKACEVIIRDGLKTDLEAQGVFS